MLKKSIIAHADGNIFDHLYQYTLSDSSSIYLTIKTKFQEHANLCIKGNYSSCANTDKS